MRNTRNILTLALAGFALAACDDISGSDFDGAPGATLSFAVAPATSTANTIWQGSRQAGVILTDAAGRTLEVTQLQVVMEDVELERQFDDDCNDVDACEKFEIGPVLIDLPVNGGVITPFDVPIPSDTYDELELEIDDASDDSTSAQFFTDHPTWPQDASIRIVGTFDANDGAGPQPFDVYLEIEAEIERELVPPLVITDSAQTVNVTVEVDVAAWFQDAFGLIDPRELATNDDMVDALEDRIEETFDAFEDDDRDGDDSDDDGSDDDDGTTDQGSGDN
ncbi:MAG TPA: hypothetical protein VF039_08760 [Longimicrobiales bacterium]